MTLTAATNENIAIDIKSKQTEAHEWFKILRDDICKEFETIEDEFSGRQHGELDAGRFERTDWDRTSEDDSDGGGGVMSVMKGRVFEKVGVNVSAVRGKFTEKFRKNIPGTDDNDGNFWACGISLVAHMRSPLVPTVHMNTRLISTSKSWFGGGTDLTPMVPNEDDKMAFHKSLKDCCDRHNPDYYETYKDWCDEYFYLPHRGEARGVGGIFYDYLDSGVWDDDFSFTKDVGNTFLSIYPQIVRHHMNKDWTDEQREQQLIKRGRYVEFNLLYDRGTKFGLMTGGNTEAILMSLPPEVKWP